jgi:hypothetical protein
LRRLISMNSKSARDKTADTGKNDAGDMASRVLSHAVAAARTAFLGLSSHHALREGEQC